MKSKKYTRPQYKKESFDEIAKLDTKDAAQLACIKRLESKELDPLYVDEYYMGYDDASKKMTELHIQIRELKRKLGYQREHHLPRK